MALVVNERKLNILELTVCSNTNCGFEEVNRRKLHKQTYCQLISDLEAKGTEVAYTTLEIGSLNWSLPASSHSISSILHSRSLKSTAIPRLTKPSILCLYHIFIIQETLLSAQVKKNHFILT